MSDGSEEAEVFFEVLGKVGVITLNRPGSLNALTAHMVRLMNCQLREWKHEDGVEQVIVRGAGEKAFCAGGDIRALYNQGRAKDPAVIEFYRDEYRLNTLIKRYPKPYIALMDGITMGGGVGVSVHGSHTIATERLVFAMPETGIGLFPDVGGTFFLPRCPGETGMYLGLTGARLGAADAVYAGIADFYVPAARLDDLVSVLAEGGKPDEMIETFCEPAGPSSLEERREEIDACFSAQSVADICARLRARGNEWAEKTARTIASKSPLSTRIAFRQIREGKNLSFEQCMQLEFRLTNRFMKGKDFYEGVRAVVIDKDQSPRWQHASVESVDALEVDACFAGLGDGELLFD